MEVPEPDQAVGREILAGLSDVTKRAATAQQFCEDAPCGLPLRYRRAAVKGLQSVQCLRVLGKVWG
jgi:hypothetical protein